MKIAAIFRSIEFLGGAERVFIDTVKLFRDGGHEVDVYILGNVNTKFVDMLRPLKTQRLKEPPKPFNRSIIKGFVNYYNTSPYKKLARTINKKNYDIIYICHLVNVIRLLGLLNDTTVCYVHEPLSRDLKNIERPVLKRIGDKIFQLFTSPIDKTCIKKADFLIANSKYTQKGIYNTYKRDSYVLYPSIDTEIFTPSPSERKNKIFIPGRIDPLKNQIMALEALELIDGKCKKDYEILLEDVNTQTSYPYYVSKVESMVNKLKNDGWHSQIYNSVADDVLIKYYQQSIVTLYPPRFEPFGMIPVESMSCGTPVISLNEGGPKESIVHEETGFLCNNNIKEYADYIQFMLDNPGEAKKMGINGRKRVWDNFSHKQFTNKLETLLIRFVK